MSTCSEPHISEQILWQMIDDLPPAGSTLCPFLNTKVLTVLKTGNVVNGVTTGFTQSDVWTAHVVIDATEYGDVLPLAGARYRIGRTKSGGPSAPNNCIQDITYVAVARQYPSGVPAPEIPAMAGYNVAEGQFANFFGVDLNGPNLCPNPGWLPDQMSWGYFRNYRGMPDSAIFPPPPPPAPTSPNSSNTRAGANHDTNDYPGWFWGCTDNVPEWWTMHWRGKLSTNFLESPTLRNELTCKAKLLTLQFMRYLHSSPWGMPSWAIAADEYVSPTGTCNAYFDPILQPFERMLAAIPYVRESRRIVSVDPLTGAEIQRNVEAGLPPVILAPESLAVGEYETDMHNCKDEGDLEHEPGDPIQETLTHRSPYAGPYQIPFATFVPEVVDGFLPAEKNLGYSRMASASARMQPTVMLVGQAAGTLAALAATGNSQPRAVRVLNVQKALLEWNAALAVQTFSDVPIGHSSWRDAQIVATREVMTDFVSSSPGIYTFRVGDSGSRADIATALVRAFRISTDFPGAPPQTYADLPPSHPAHFYVEALVREGFDDLLDPQHRGNFFPGNALLREQFADWLARAWWGATLPTPPAQPTFADVGTSHPHFLAVEAVVKAGPLMFDCAPTPPPAIFCPSTSLTRGELARSLAQVLYKNTTIWP